MAAKNSTRKSKSNSKALHAKAGVKKKLKGASKVENSKLMIKYP